MVVSQPASAPAFSPQHRSVFALANGRIGVEGAIEECACVPDCIMPDAFLIRPIDYHEAFPGYARETETRVMCPSPLLFHLMIDGAAVDFSNAEILAFSRSLDLSSGILARTAEWRLGDGKVLRIAVDRLVPRDGPALVASRIRITPLNFSARVAVIPDFGMGTDPALAEAADPRIAGRTAGAWVADDGMRALDIALFRNDDIRIAYRQSIRSDSGVSRDAEGREFVSAILGECEELSFDRVVEVACARGPLPDNSLGEPVSSFFNTHAAAQRRSLDAFWAKAQCSVEGDEELSLALRYNLFQLEQSSSRSDDHSIAAKGLTGEGYEGHYFWDAEAFMLPALALIEPDRARTLLAYRARVLDHARENARAMGHGSGALYPWRTIGGRECSSHYPTGAAQYHINGDIAHALQFYVDATGDEDFLWESGAAMLFETARIWMQLGRFDERRGGAFCIYAVTGPDEYSALVDNDFYTNAIAKRHLEFAAATAERMQVEQADAFQGLCATIGLSTGEPDEWRLAAERMWLPVDPATGVNPQDDSFLGKPSLPAGMMRRKGRPLLLDHHPLNMFRHRVCKQGDVVQAIAMDLLPMPLSLKERNFRFYEPLTTHDSTLSSVAFAIAAAEIGDDQAALSFQKECALVDLQDLHQNTSHGLHLAALAGSWLALVQGWGGFRVREGAPSLRPAIHPDWNAYTFRMAWRGSLMQVRVDGRGAHYRLLSGAPLQIFDHGRAITVDADGCIMPRPRIRGVIFDLDGVLTDTAEDHYQAWQALADRHGLRFDRQFNERLKGVDRRNSLRLILEHSGAVPPEATIEEMLAEKNRIYCRRLEAYSPSNLFPGVAALFAACRAAGLKIALASASRNAADVLSRLGIAADFDFIADAGAIAEQKPAPDIFLACADGMGLTPETCVGVEDASAGIAAILASGMTAIGLGAPDTLAGAHLIVPRIGALSIDAILSCGDNREIHPPEREFHHQERT